MKKRQKILGYRHKKKKQKTNFLIKSTHRSDSLETVFSHYGHSVSRKNKKYRILLSFFLPRLHACLLTHFSRVQLFVTPWTAARQAPLSTGILQACHALLQAIFLTQGSNPGLLCFLHWQVDSTAESPGKPLSRLVKGKIFAVAREQEHDLVGKRKQVTDGGLTQIPAQSLNDKVPLAPNSMPVDSIFHIDVWAQRRSACSGQSFSFWQVCALDNSVFGFFLGFFTSCSSRLCAPPTPIPCSPSLGFACILSGRFSLNTLKITKC